MSRGEVLIKALLDSMDSMADDESGLEDVKAMIDATSALKLYIAGLENAIAFIAGTVEGAVELITKPEDDNPFKREDFNKCVEEHEMYMEMQREGFETFE